LPALLQSWNAFSIPSLPATMPLRAEPHCHPTPSAVNNDSANKMPHGFLPPHQHYCIASQRYLPFSLLSCAISDLSLFSLFLLASTTAVLSPILHACLAHGEANVQYATCRHSIHWRMEV
jgi:hypothetical protein